MIFAPAEAGKSIKNVMVREVLRMAQTFGELRQALHDLLERIDEIGRSL